MCGTQTYSRADMVGDLCPPCASERDLGVAVNEAFADAERAKEVLAAQREEREERAEEARRTRERTATRQVMPVADSGTTEAKANPDGSVEPRKPLSKAKAAT